MTVRVEWLTGAEREAVYAEAVAILERVGMKMKGAAVLPLLREAGARVDGDGVVRFPSELVERAVAACPREVLMAGETTASDVLLDGSRSFFNVSGCAAKTLDRETGVVRPSTLADLRDGTIVLDATPELDVVWTFLTATDVPLERRELVEYYTYLTETAKPVVFVDCPSETGHVRRIFETVSGDLERFRARPRVSLLCAARSPLEVNGGLLDVAVEFASLGSPVWAYSMPISGATAPVTPAGTLALLWAEVLGTITAIETAVPGAPVIACCGPGILDMRHTTMSLGNLESTLMGAASVEIGHHLGIPVHNSGLSTDAKHCGVQAGYEKGLKVMAAVATGADIVSGGFGFLDSSSTFSLPMVPVDAEIAAMARRMARGIEISPETLMGDSFARVGIGGDFLREKETRRRVRAGEHYVPRIGSRLPFEQWLAEGRTEVDAAGDSVRAALAARAERGPRLTGEQRAELAGICGIGPEHAA
ncbi:MAG TPA: trimethylamine methyltransferase family protein [Thermoleophilia bacterium]|nr:trimethylamine methyltransferase family protein [Thermoleophilia bacterium]